MLAKLGRRETPCLSLYPKVLSNYRKLVSLPGCRKYTLRKFMKIYSCAAYTFIKTSSALTHVIGPINTVYYLTTLCTNHIDYHTKYNHLESVNYRLEQIWIFKWKLQWYAGFVQPSCIRQSQRPCSKYNGEINGIDYMFETWAQNKLIFKPNL